jgi:hypothetical protein
MAPRTRTQTPTRKAAKDSRRPRGKSRTAPPDPELTCRDCGKPCKSPAGLASHRRTQHPDELAVVAVDPAAASDAEPSAAADRAIPVPPEGLGGPALTLWRQIVNVYDLRPDELRILEDACGEAMLIDRLKRELDGGAPLIVLGSMRQQVASPLLTEIRQHRGTLGQLLARLHLPDDPHEVSGDSPAERSVKARAAANARWRRGTS